MKSFLKCFDSLLCLTDLIDSCHPSENSIIDNQSRGNNVYLRALSFYCKHQLQYKETNLNCKRSWRELRFVLAATLLSGREDISSGSGCSVDELVVRVGPYFEDKPFLSWFQSPPPPTHTQSDTIPIHTTISTYLLHRVKPEIYIILWLYN